jgi:hypothetical protein
MLFGDRRPVDVMSCEIWALSFDRGRLQDVPGEHWAAILVSQEVPLLDHSDYSAYTQTGPTQHT